MANTSFNFPICVTLYDLDVREQVSCATLFRYFEETAMRGSEHFGFALEWYRAKQHFWVIRTLRIARMCPPRYQDKLNIRTWVSSMSRVRSDRNYEVRRASDGLLMARGIANWVYVDEKKMTPARIDPEIRAMFERHDPPTLPPLDKVTSELQSPALFEWTSTRRAQFYEADSAQHINNAVYVDWLEEAIRDALGAMGYAITLNNTTPLPWFYRHELEYVRSAVPGDEVTIQTQLLQLGQTIGEWTVAMYHEQDLLLRARSTMLWVNAANRPVPWHKLENSRLRIS